MTQRHRSLSIALAVLWILLSASATRAQSFFDQFVDPEDGNLDTSEWLGTKTGFLPVPIVISDPAVGYGGGIAAVFFHDPLAGAPAESSAGERPRRAPPSITFVAGAGTANGSWFAGGGHFGVWDDDRYRYLGLAGYGSINLDYYGPGGTLPAPIGFNIEGTVLLQELKVRLLDTDIFLGPRYELVTTQIRPSSGTEIPGVSGRELRPTTSGLGLTAQWSGVDNVLTPSRGVDAGARALFNAGALGSDFDYQMVTTYAQGFYDLWQGDLAELPRIVLGLRLDGGFSFGDPPFYQQPFINMRGIPALRYQDQYAVWGETEVRWNFYSRWALVGFVGVGTVFSDDQSFGSGPTPVTKGFGIRYLMARLMGMQVGVDVAFGPEDTVGYLQVGHAWGTR